MASSNNLKQLSDREERILVAIREGLFAADSPLRQAVGRQIAVKLPPVSVDRNDASVDEVKVTEPLCKLTQPEASNNKVRCSSPSIAPRDSLIETNAQTEARRRDKISNRGPSVAGRLLRTCVLGVFVIGLVGALLALPSYEPQLKRIVFAAQDFLQAKNGHRGID